MRRARRIVSRAALAASLCAGAIICAPQLLAFPYAARIGRYLVRAERPIPAGALAQVLADADARLATSPIDRPRDEIALFLTDGGWRWRLLSLTSRGAFGLTRAINSAILVNRSDIAADRAINGAAIGGARPLSQVIAHEETHNLLRHHFGFSIDLTVPAWKREGYCDHVAGGGSLDARTAAYLEAHGMAHPALVYFHGRQQVDAMLAANGGSVDSLFAS